jgi:predicted membrane chloride channel (bestrophin family)
MYRISIRNPTMEGSANWTIHHYNRAVFYFRGEVLETNLLRIMCFLVGFVFVCGGLKLAHLSVESARGMLNIALFGIVGFVLGLYLCTWAVSGFPQ